MQGPITTFSSGTTPGSIGTLDRSGKPNIRRFYGKYRGKVADNVDPLFLGRILPIVPAVSELPLTWATPCVPYAGPEVGFCAIPPIDANVWIEFEGGDPDYPIWTGCFWEEGQTPLGPLTPETFIFKTTSTTMVVRELPGGDGISLELTFLAAASPINITLDAAGIQIQTEAVFELNSQATNITSDEVSVESDDTNFSGAALTIESEETNIAGTRSPSKAQRPTLPETRSPSRAPRRTSPARRSHRDRRNQHRQCIPRYRERRSSTLPLRQSHSKGRWMSSV